MSVQLNPKNLVVTLGNAVNNAMLEAAEPEVQKALKNIEVAMRKELARNLIASIDHSFSVEAFQDNILIRIKQDKQ